MRTPSRADPFLGLWVLALWAVLVLPAWAQDTGSVKALDVLLNGRDTGEVIDFTVERNGLSVRAADLRRLGFLVPPGADRVTLSDLKGVTYAVDERRQTLVLHAGRGAVRPEVIALDAGGRDLRAQVSPGALINYNLTATETQGRAGLTGEVEARVFGRFGVLDAANLLATDSAHPFRRLDTTWSFADPGSMRRYAVGDLISGGLAWTRPVRMAGAQASSDFTMRPDMVAFPTPTLKGDVAAASTVDVFVNGEKKYSGPVAGGAFDLASVPVLTGANQISLVVTDASGRRSVQSLPFYASPVLLAAGLASFSGELGVLRQGYGGSDDQYGGAVASASARYGVSPAWTVEGHAEAGPDQAMAGIGSSFAVRFGVLTVAAAGSAAGRSRGGYANASFERVSSRFSLSAGVEGTVGDFRDLATLGAADAVPRVRTRLQLGLPLDNRSAVNVAYIHTLAAPDDPAAGGDAVAVSYSRDLGRGLSLAASAYSNQGASQGKTLFLTLTALLGGRSAGISAITGGAAPSVLAQAAKPAAGPNDTEWRLAVQSGSQSQILGEVGRNTAVGDFTLGVDRLNADTAVQATASGSLVLMDRHLFAAKPIDSSFAVVQAGAPGVAVMSENRLVGRSDASGRLLVPDLRPYQANTIALNAADVPFDMTLEKAVLVVDPLDRVGVMARFDTRASAQALLVLVDGRGKPIAVGSRVADGSRSGAVVGYDGEALVTGLKPRNSLAVRTDDGRACIARFDYAPVLGRISRIGPVACTAEPAL
jgi:outer membrane usher protein